MRLSRLLNLIDEDEYIYIENVDDLELGEEENNLLCTYDVTDGYCRTISTLSYILDTDNYFVTRINPLVDFRGFMTGSIQMPYLGLTLKQTGNRK